MKAIARPATLAWRMNSRADLRRMWSFLFADGTRPRSVSCNEKPRRQRHRDGGGRQKTRQNGPTLLDLRPADIRSYAPLFGSKINDFPHFQCLVFISQLF